MLSQKHLHEFFIVMPSISDFLSLNALKQQRNIEAGDQVEVDFDSGRDL